MATTDFATLRNLAFYDGAEQDYFYFKSLETYRNDIDEYNEKAEQISNSALSALRSMPSFAEDENTLASEQIDKLIKFIEEAVKTEKNNEIAYFKNKIATFKNTDGLKDLAAIQELSQYLTPETFKYDKVIALINVLMQGFDNTVGIVEHEIKHIESIDDAMKNLKDAHESKLNGLWRSEKSGGIKNHWENNYEDYLDAAKKRLDRKILISYAHHGNLTSSIDSEKRKLVPGVKKWLSQAAVKESVDVTVAHWVTQTIHEIMASPQAYSTFIQELNKNYDFERMGMSQSQVENTIRQYLIRLITTFATKNLSKILNNAFSALDTKDLADLLTDSIDLVGQLDIEGLYDNFGMFGRTVELFKQASQQADLEQNAARGLYDAYLAFRKELKELKTKHGKMTMEQQFLKRAMSTGTEDDKYSPIYTLISRLESLQKKLEERQRSGRKINDNWLKQQKFTVADEAVGGKVTIQLKLDDSGKIDLKDVINQLQHTRAIKNLGGRKSRANSLEGLITGLKARTSQSIKKDLINSLSSLTTLAQKKGLGGEQYVIDAIRTAIENKKISIGGPAFSEVKQGIQESLRSSNSLNDWIGKLNKKNDFVVTVSIDDSVPDLQAAIEKMLNHRAEVIAEDVASSLKQATDNYLKGFVDDFYKTIGSVSKEDESFNSYKANADAFFEAAKQRDTIYQNIDDISTEIGLAWSNYAKEMEAAGKSTKEINKKRQSVIDTFKNSFFESSTMKTYNQYQSNIGFIGGSLGATVLDQLENLNEIFTAADMPISPGDMDWLYSAIINCSPISLIGEQNKNIIEDYLGSMAAFALFDEGGAEAEIISGVAERTRKGYSTPEILHIYAVDSIMVPGSYVLTKVLEELKACAANAYKAYQSQRKGATISIINTMNEGMVPNRGKNIDTNNPPNTDPWGTVAERAHKAVKLKILFLAGLLDIAHDIEKTLSTIELPS